ncbi:conserved hypothetical protein [Leishmania major strain Friedlin]|uniref:Uncharacterized protein n=1 Tax=Leishmania major TaxID=5664 RepID=Q4QCX8_LEIMA|nr:conserved hypothetical protein [Leishmania major strain Friedlin]CAG9573138.1 hypothetical_protein_-_conserved [Leishmania major strain Friedlin]CAJ03784.1 conserved hypothetical protein [Leishmania major strain Friedlin]|eukprot:XP_001682820.1 conserved hypothetical protein [Leishmania major strain Friedlin]
MLRQALAPLGVNGASISHDTASVAPHSTSDGGGSCTTRAVAGITDGGADVSKHLEFAKHGHHSQKHNQRRPPSSSSASKASALVQTIREHQVSHARETHVPVLDSISPHTDAARASTEEHVGISCRTAHAPAPHDITASPVAATSATPSPHSARGTKVVDINPHPSVAAAVMVAAAHPPLSNKLNAPSRRSSMARLRQQVKAQLKGVEVAEPADDTSPASACDSDAVAAALRNGAAQGGETEEQLSLYSHQPALPSTLLAFSTSAEVASLKGSGMVTEALAMPAVPSVGAAKVLPHGLRSPSAITDVGAAPLDYSELGTEESEPVSNVSPARYYYQQQQKRSASLHKQRTDSVPSSHIGGALQPNTPFHALQFGSCAPANSVGSPPLLCPSEEPPHLHSLHQCHGLRLDSEEGADASFRQGSRASRESINTVTLRSRPARTTKAAAGGRSSTSSPAVSDCELPSLIVCPFALMGCCAEGAHRIADLHKGTTLHHHLMAVTTCVQRMRGRQQELERLVRGLQQQVHKQALMLREAREVERARQRPAASPSVLISSRGSSMDGCLCPASTPAGGTNALNSCKDRKALPRDVSIREPLVAEYGIGDEDDVRAGKHASEIDAGGDSPGRRAQPPRGTQMQRGGSHSVRRSDGDRDGARVYARQLRMRTAAGQQRLHLVDAPSSASVSLTPVWCGLRSLASAGTATAAQKTTAAEVQGLGEKMRRATAVQQKQQEQQQGSANGGEQAPSCTPKQNNLHRDGIEDLSTVSGDGLGDDDDSVQGKRCMTTLSAPRLSGADIGTESGCSPTRHGRCAAAPYVHYGAYPRQQPGAGGSTEVSGMSNVPPYQVPNESVSPIRSASLDLDDHEDDTDAGAMCQQLLNLTSTEIPVATRAEESCITGRTGQPGARAKWTTDPQLSPAASPRSAPSLVSVTYRPSELACAEGSDDEGAVHLTGRVSPTRGGSASAVAAANRQVRADDASRRLLLDSVRLAAPLQRPTLVRKSDVVRPPPTARDGADGSKTVLPLLTPPSLATLADASVAAAATSILSKSDVQRPRQMSAPESGGTRGPLSGINFDAPSSALPVRASLLVASASGGFIVNHSSVHASYNGTSEATPLPEPVSKRSSASKNHLVHAHSYRVDKDATGEHCGALAGSASYALGGPCKSGGRRSGSQTRRGAAMRRPLHVTSVLSPQEAVDQGVAVHPLGLPPRRES